MDPFLIAGIAVGALVVGFCIGWLFTSRKTIRIEADLENERRAGEERLRTVQEAEQHFRDAFKALSAETLEESQKTFLDLASRNMGKLQELAVHDLESRRKAVDDLVRPIEESLKKVDGKLGDLEKERTGAYAALRQQVEGMARTQKELHEETTRLVRALRSPDVGGRWGEIQLHRVVEMAGMVDHCDFQEQETREGEKGRQRPDLVVHLPGGKHIVVDAKAPLTAYLDAQEATNVASRNAKLAEHGRKVREHITLLGSKSYQQQFQPSPDFVVMFLPGETFFSAAVQQDPSLIEYGVDRYVIPASPTTLIALLRAVHYGWQQEKVAENAQRISALGREMYERIRAMAGHLADVRKGLDRAVSSYNKAIGSYESRVLVTARRFREMGAGTKDEIPPAEGTELSARSLQPAEDLAEMAEPD